MKKDKKITVKYFENTKLKPFKFENQDIYPLYFQISHAKERSKFKCALLDDFLLNILNFNSDIDSQMEIKSWDKIKSALITHDLNIINLIIDKIKQDKGEFNLEYFKLYYTYYSTNIFKIIDGFYLKKVNEFLTLKGITSIPFYTMKYSFNVDSVLRIIKDINPSLLTEIEKYSIFHKYIYDGIAISNWIELKFLEYPYDNDGNFIVSKNGLNVMYNFITLNKYFSLMEWHKMKDYIIDQTTSIIQNSFLDWDIDPDTGETIHFNTNDDKVELAISILNQLIDEIDISVKTLNLTL